MIVQQYQQYQKKKKNYQEKFRFHNWALAPFVRYDDDADDADGGGGGGDDWAYTLRLLTWGLSSCNKRLILFMKYLYLTMAWLAYK